MTKTSHHAHGHAKGEHGTTKSYVIGFILSLVFTAIPYYTVVNETISGSALLATIIGVALLQMIVQIVFFLHLGRGPKPLYNVVFFIATVGIIFVVVVGSIWIMNHLNYNMAPVDMSKYLIEREGIYQIDGEKTGACYGDHDNHKVVIKDGKVNPAYIVAKRCDTITFINEDNQLRELAFGAHPQHDSYAGETEVPLRTGRNKTITLSEVGAYNFHDHFEPTTGGHFTVSE